MTELFGLGLFGLGLGLFGSVFGLRLIMPRVSYTYVCWNLAAVKYPRFEDIRYSMKTIERG
jgi:hypothetical protein